MSMRQRSTKTAKYKISYRERLAVFNNEQMSTLQGDLYMAPDQTKTNVSISTPDQENERPYSRQRTFNRKETETNKDFDKGSFIKCFSNNKCWVCTEQSAAVFREVTIWYSYYRKSYINIFKKYEFMWKDKFSFYFSKSFCIDQKGRFPWL